MRRQSFSASLSFDLANYFTQDLDVAVQLSGRDGKRIIFEIAFNPNALIR